MPRVPALSPATQNPTPSHFVHVGHGSFLDSNGRTLIFRGVNLSGSSKANLNQPSQKLEGFWEVAENGGESFVGRPLNLEDGSADIHLARLRGWGFNVIRYVVTWEALEHAGPRQYDYEFMDYTVRCLRKIKEYGFRVYMDPHQDVWSRYSGGSGAPYWTLLACGMNPRNFSAGWSSIIHAEYPLPTSPAPETLPAMIWSTNYSRLVSQTVWTLFFAGRSYAPKCIIDGVNIQDWLQSHFIAAFGLLADRIRDAGDLLDEVVFAWDSLNEPGEGFLGLEDLNEVPKHQALKKGPTPSPIQGLRLGSGIPQTVDNFAFGAMGPSREGSVTIDPAGRSIWADPATEPNGVHLKWGWKRDSKWQLGICVWALHGVWDPESGQALIRDYFARIRPDPQGQSRPTGEPVDFVPDFWKPFWKTYARRIRQAHPEAILFIQPPVFVQPAPLEEEDLKGRAAYSAHYYDGLTLMTRHWNWFNADSLGLLRGKYKTTLAAVRIGTAMIRASIREQLGMLKDDSLSILGPYPTIIGEIGTPMDMDSKRAYGWTDGGKHKGDYGSQVNALDASLNGADGVNALNYTIWTYCTDNTHQWGDGWNLEDLSLWSADDLRHRGPHLTPSRKYVNPTPSSSKAMLLAGRSRTSSTSSGPDSDPQPPVPTFTSSTPPILTPVINESVESIASALTLSNEYRLRSRTPNGTRFGESSTRHDTELSNQVTINIHPATGDSSKLFFPPLQPMPVYEPPSNPFAFLTDGARAVAAFSRPYPRAIVGQSKTIDFDIGKAEFKFTVTVNWCDVPDNKFTPDAVPPTTEIYLPLVHYASEAYVHELEMSDEVVRMSGGTEATLGPACDDGEEYPPPRIHGGRSRSDTLASEGLPGPDPYLSSSLTLGQSFPINPLSSPPSETHYAPVIPSDAFSIEVEVSHGSWMLDTRNQMLYWTYPIPDPDEREADYTIRIRRQGGPIKRVVDGTITQPVEAKDADRFRNPLECCRDTCCIIM
ncbi:hypothetical protein FRB99_003430 [Tulasnella sp. 403]|nr:hypothetical protein FRB99_003430 [Tulasnella sp. 403]